MLFPNNRHHISFAIHLRSGQTCHRIQFDFNGTTHRSEFVFCLFQKYKLITYVSERTIFPHQKISQGGQVCPKRDDLVGGDVWVLFDHSHHPSPLQYFSWPATSGLNKSCDCGPHDVPHRGNWLLKSHKAGISLFSGHLRVVLRPPCRHSSQESERVKQRATDHLKFIFSWLDASISFLHPSSYAYVQFCFDALCTFSVDTIELISPLKHFCLSVIR